jgi:hypothetical protein
MSTWKDVGAWLSRNGTEGANLVGSLLTGNLGNAVEAGVKLVSGATYYATPDQALSVLQNDPQALERLLGSIAYVILMPSPNEKVFDGLMMLPYIYMGLRTFDKLSALRSKA